MKKTKVVYLMIALILLVIIAFMIFKPSDELGEFDSLVDCMASKDVKMYGAYWCSHCNDQKELFRDSKDSFKEKLYIECAEDAFNNEREKCIQAGITGYPTWIINGEKVLGTKSMKQLAELSGCEL